MACGLASGYILLSEIYDATAQSGAGGAEHCRRSTTVEANRMELVETVENARVFSSI